jgi:hypothetical protein
MYEHTKYPFVTASTYNELVDGLNEVREISDHQLVRMNEVVADNNRQIQEIAELRQSLEDLKKLNQDQSRRLQEKDGRIELQTAAIQDTNNHLFDAGKSLANFLKAWKFRKENPNMNPKTRQNNNADLDLHLDALVSEMPKQVEQDPDPAKKD